MDTEQTEQTPRPAPKKKLWPWLVLGVLVAGGAVVAAMVYQASTDFGHIRVKLSEPDAAVAFKVDGQPLRLDADGTARIPAGQHTLEVSGQDYKTETHPFRLKRGTTELINIELQSTLPPDPVAQRNKEIEKLLSKASNLLKGPKRNVDEAIRLANDILQLDGDSVSALELRGTLYVETDKLDAGLADLTRALKKDPGRPQAFLGRGLAYFKKSNLQRCIEECTAAINLDPKLVAAYQQRGLAYFQSGETEKGVADASEVLEVLPDDAVALEKRGLGYGELGDDENALKDLDRLLQQNPKNARLMLARCEINGRLGNLAQALKDRAAAFSLDRKLAGLGEPVIQDAIVRKQAKMLTQNQRKAAELTAKARLAHRYNNKDELQRFAKEALDLDPENGEAHALLASYLSEQDETRNLALGHCDEAIKHDKRCALAYLTRAMLHDEAKEPEKIVADATVAMRLAPLDAQAYARRATGFRGMLEYAQALSDCKTALLINPNEVQAWANLGYVEAMLGNYDKALENYTKYLLLRPKDARAYLERAGVYLKKNDIAKAKADQTRAENIDSELEKEDPPVFPEPNKPPQPTKLSEADQATVKQLLSEAETNVRKLLNQAEADRDAKEVKACLKMFEQVLAIDPLNVQARLLRVELLVATGEHAQAVRDCNKVIFIQPESARAYELRGYAKKKSAAAIADLTIAVRLQPDNAAAWEYRGHHFYTEGDYEQARADYTMAVKHDPKRAYALVNRAYCHAFQANYPRAMADMEAAANLGHNEAEFHWVWAALYDRLGDGARAAAHRTRAVKIDRRILDQAVPNFPNPPGEVETAPPPAAEPAEPELLPPPTRVPE